MPASQPSPDLTTVKCVVWDLDNTVWKGVLLEETEVPVREGVAEAVRRLDHRGILQSVASRNDPATATAKLDEAGLSQYLLVPQIGWGSKSSSVQRIAQRLNIGLDSLLFVDDDPFERDEVSAAHPAVRALSPQAMVDFVASREFSELVITGDGGRRRLLYQETLARDEAEEDFEGPPQEFLETLQLHLTVRPAQTADLTRAEELTVRTHQLNATGVTYSAGELDRMANSPDHILLVAELSDRFGSYGTVGLILIETGADTWILRLLIVSCRVLSRGIGTLLLNLVIARAVSLGKKLHGAFNRTERNRAMFVAYRFAGFRTRPGEPRMLEFQGTQAPAVPAHVRIDLAW